MKKTYRAMQVSRRGTRELVDRAAPGPGDGEVLIQVEACGISGADAGAIEGLEPAVKYPRVAGREVVGRITATDRGGASVVSSSPSNSIGTMAPVAR
jgi:alcohol dehydrogenase